MTPRILFVDDEPMVLEAFKRILRDHRPLWEIHFVQSAQEALSLMTTLEFDAVVTDFNMPGQTGFSLLEEIRTLRETFEIPVVILTGSQERDMKRRALELGATDLLHKPVNREDLIARLNSMLRLKSCQDALKAQNALLEEKVQERTRMLARSRLDMLWRLGKAAEFRDEGAGSHIMRVACYCRVIARALELSEDFIELLFLTSPLHDIGKIGIPDSILLKPGRLTPDERAVMQRHCTIGFRILQEDSHTRKLFCSWGKDDATLAEVQEENPLLEMAATIALTHHEKWDGAGYPHGLSGDDIPLAARIVAVADVYDALCSSRPYKPAYSEDQVIKIMREGVGGHFDPSVFHGFERALKAIRSIRAQFPAGESGECHKAA